MKNKTTLILNQPNHDCLFCQIINHQVMVTRLWEDDQVLVFLDLFAITKGHCLIIPKQHSDTILTCPDEVLALLLVHAKKVALLIEHKLHALGFNILVNVNGIAQQQIFHSHVHVIPKYTKHEGFQGNATPQAIKLTEEQLIIIKNQLIDQHD